MNEKIEAIKSSILDSLDKAKTALNNKEVSVETLKVSEIPDYIRQIELNKIKLTVNCSEFDSGTIKATKDGKTRTGNVQDGQCIIMLSSTGTWHVEHDLGDYVETEVSGDTSTELVKKKVTFSEVDCSEEKITIHVDSVVGNNSNDNFIRVKKNGVIIEVQAQLVGSDIEITNFEYEDGATYTIEYVIKDEVRGSVEIEAVNKEAYTVDSSKGPLDDVYSMESMFHTYSDFPTHIVFTDQKAPQDATTYGWSKDGSNSIVKWLDSNTNTLYISSQKTGQKIIWDKLSRYVFCDSGGLGNPNNQKTETIDFANIDTSKMTSMSNMFYGCTKLKEIKNFKNLNTCQVTNMNNMFGNCKSLDEIDLEGFITNKVTDMVNMFSYCTQIRKLDLSNFIIDKVNSTTNMFSMCSNLTTIYASEWANNNSINSSQNMFLGSESLPNYSSSKDGISMAKWKENGGYFTNPAEKDS